MTIRKELIQDIRQGRLIVVTGTGVSSSISGNVLCSSWRGLLQDGIEQIATIDDAQYRVLKMRLEYAKTTEDLTGIAKDIKRLLSSNFGRWIARTIGNLKVARPELARAVASLRAPILTTNYDTLLEEALGRSSVSWANPSEMRRLLTHRSQAIGHLHGVHSDSQNIVFSDEDYSRVVSDSAAQQLQTSAFTMYTFLFIGVGSGLDDPNFSPMIKSLSDGFPDDASSHYRLCRNSDVDPKSRLEVVNDLGFGDSYDDLEAFITELVSEANLDELNLASKSRNMIVDTLRGNTILWREASSLDEKEFHDLVVTPSFLPEPHNEYSNNHVVMDEKSRPTLVNIDEMIREGGIVVLAGEENSGVSTALAYILHRSIDVRPGSHAILVDSPQSAGINAVEREVNTVYRAWGVTSDARDGLSDSLILGVDNIRFDGTQRIQRAISGIKGSRSKFKVVATTQSDALEVANALSHSGETAKVIYLGRFSDVEAKTLARLLVPERADEVARDAMTVIRDKNLPRTPFTVTLLVELVQGGVALRSEESEIAVLDQYLDLLIGAEFGRIAATQGMTTRQKRKALEAIARRFVELKEDAAPLEEVMLWLTSTFKQLGWENFSVRHCLQEMISRRVLVESADHKIRFQRSAYLELMAGVAANEDREFRNLVFEAPIQLASIVRSYAAMARNDREVVELVEVEIDRVQKRALRGAVFRSVRQVEARSGLFADQSEAESRSTAAKDTEHPDAVVQREGMTGTYYDDRSDADSPAFLTAYLDELSEARVAMLVVDLASRVLRDSDEVPDQELKSRVLRKVLHAWVAFTDLYEVELSNEQELTEVIEQQLKLRNGSDEFDQMEVSRFASFFTMLVPVLLADSGMGHCLSAPSLVTRLEAEEFRDETDGHAVSIVRANVLLLSGGHQWISSLSTLSEEAVRSFFCASFFASRVRFEYLTDTTLTREQRHAIRAFLRRVIDAKYTFKTTGQRNGIMNNFENELRESLLRRGTPGPRKVTP